MNNLINIEIINTYIKENKLTKTGFCKKCKVGLSTFNKIISGKNFNLIFLFRIAKTMKIGIAELFVSETK